MRSEFCVSGQLYPHQHKRNHPLILNNNCHLVLKENVLGVAGFEVKQVRYSFGMSDLLCHQIQSSLWEDYLAPLERKGENTKGRD